MVGKTVAGFFTNLAKNWILKPLATVFSVIFMYSFHALVKASPGRAFQLMKKISSTYYTPPREWAGFISSYMEQMTGGKIDLDEIIEAGAGGSGRRAMELLGEKFLQPMLAMIMPEPPIKPEDGIDAAERYLGMNLQFQMSAWFLHVLGDMMSFGIFKSLKDLPNAISWSFGLGWLSWLVMGTPFRYAIQDPLDEHFKRVYKPTKLTVSQLIEAWQKGLMSSTDLVENLRWLGYNDANIEYLVNISKKEIPESILTKLYQEHLITDDELQREIKGKGYSDTFAALISQLHLKDREIEQRNKLIAQLEDLYVRGVVDQAVMRDAYRRANWNDREADIAIERLNAEKVKRSQLSDSDIANAVEKDLLPWAEARDILMARGYSRRDADLFIKLRVPNQKWV